MASSHDQLLQGLGWIYCIISEEVSFSERAGIMFSVMLPSPEVTTLKYQFYVLLSIWQMKWNSFEKKNHLSIKTVLSKHRPIISDQSKMMHRFQWDFPLSLSLEMQLTHNLFLSKDNRHVSSLALPQTDSRVKLMEAL